MTPLYENPHNHNQNNHIINMPMKMLFTAINRPDKLCPLSSMCRGTNNSNRHGTWIVMMINVSLIKRIVTTLTMQFH